MAPSSATSARRRLGRPGRPTRRASSGSPTTMASTSASAASFEDAAVVAATVAGAGDHLVGRRQRAAGVAEGHADALRTEIEAEGPHAMPERRRSGLVERPCRCPRRCGHRPSRGPAGLAAAALDRGLGVLDEHAGVEARVLGRGRDQRGTAALGRRRRARRPGCPACRAPRGPGPAARRGRPRRRGRRRRRRRPGRPDRRRRSPPPAA